jgi:ATP-dependent Clp protease ATP-binding subunit ClpA
MYERFTDRARKVMQLAKQEAQRLKHGYTGTEHILLGLVREGSGVAANVLKNLDIDLQSARRQVEQIVQCGPEDVVVVGMLPQTPRAKKVIEYSIEEARNLNHNYVGTEHLLLGLLREQEGVAAQVLMNLGLMREAVREEVVGLLGGDPRPLYQRGLFPPHPRCELPEEVRRATVELDAQIKQLDTEKEAAVIQQDFVMAAHLRDQADRRKKQREQIIRAWLAHYRLDPSWLSANSDAAGAIALSVVRDGRRKNLPILADALEDAGCTDQELLGHCRQPGDHSDRCWVVDLLLDKVRSVP